MTSHSEKLELAVTYLRERKIYITEFPFVPTNAAKTDVAATIRRYRQQVLGVTSIKKVTFK